jgi:hypothetical protein
VNNQLIAFLVSDYCMRFLGGMVKVLIHLTLILIVKRLNGLCEKVGFMHSICDFLYQGYSPRHP